MDRCDALMALTFEWQRVARTAWVTPANSWVRSNEGPLRALHASLACQGRRGDANDYLRRFAGRFSGNVQRFG